MKNDYKKNKYGVISSICLFIAMVSISIAFVFEIELIRGILFYGSIILGILSLVLSIIGLIKDQNKAMSIIALIAIVLIIVFSIYCYQVLLPKAIDESINSWMNTWL